MTHPPPNVPRAAAVHEISAALRRDDLIGAERLMSGDGAGLADDARLAAAEAAMRTRRWRDAAWWFDHVAIRDNVAEVKRCLSRNLDALQRHRPALYDTLTTLPATDRCRIGVSATGRPTVICRDADGRHLSLSPENDPLGSLARAMQQLQPVMDKGLCLSLCGVGDGYLLQQLAARPPKLFMDMQQAVYVLEPDAHVLLQCMMIHDYAGPDGPIQQERFRWFVGEAWYDDVRRAVLGDLMLPCPGINVGQGLASAPIQAALQSLINELAAADKGRATAVEKYYNAINPDERQAIFSGNPPRQPRVLILTTRFSTVLQYSSRDVAVGFSADGWDARVLIEPTAHHRLFGAAIRQVVLDWKPDLVFQIDHLRHEHKDLFPASLPFVCWVQDHMDHLLSREAGARIGPTDFVLTDAGSTYAHTCGYPPRQIIAMTKLTAPPPLLPAPIARGEDVVFVSNASGTPESLRDAMLRTFEGPDAERAFVMRCVDRAAALHAAGGTLPTYLDVCDFVREQLADAGLGMVDADFHRLARWINHPICDALYRQQALRWAAAAAKDLGLSLALYGNGWDQNPEFSPFARGPIAYGEPLHALTRRSAINLQIVPYLCLHQRLLDGICSGGFFLVRRNLCDTAPQQMLDLLDQHFGVAVSSLSAARAACPPPVRGRFERLVRQCERCLCSTGTEDPIEMVRGWQDASLLVSGAGVLPHLDEVSFDNAAELRERLDTFARHGGLRERIVGAQRASIVGRLTYAANMARVARCVGQRLPTRNIESPAFPGITPKHLIGSAA